MKQVEQDGWVWSRDDRRHHVNHYPTKSGIVIIAGHPNVGVPKGTLGSILKQAGTKQR